ncbi:hypothetical protein C496_02627 [Natronorubrum tibetense GA33]|uniref:Uncharacterized protein n=1 Tax=Natronorubrum tibetense GA33 TaxID=1114856 RepID=L9W949_9EURY|nr:hypothetical protein [Natronorubrum tibetense]ELY45801.1 hypothetical protein C496_02627 [Natronorubrum tibetense GA33]
MTHHRWIQFVRWQMAWMVTAVFGLVALGALTYELFFLLTMLGLLVVSDLTAPSAVQPRWRSRLRLLLAFGLVAFSIVLMRRILEIQGIGILS